MQQAGVRTPSLQRHLERFDRHVTVINGAQGPANDKPREKVEDDREVELPAAADQRTPWCRRPTADSDRVPRTDGPTDWRPPADRDRSSSCPEPLPGARHQTVFLHQADDALATDTLVLLDQIFVNPRAPVALGGSRRRRRAPARASVDRSARARTPAAHARHRSRWVTPAGT